MNLMLAAFRLAPLLIGWTRAEDCKITTRQEADKTIITRDCATTVVVITCDLLLAHCTEESHTKTATATTSMSISSTHTSTTLTRSTTSATITSVTATVSSVTPTLTMSSTSTRTTMITTAMLEDEANDTNDTNGTEAVVPVVAEDDVITTTSAPGTSTTSSSSTLVQSSTSAELVIVKGILSFAHAGVSQSAAEKAVASTLSKTLGLPLRQIGTNAEASNGLSGRTWRITFEIEVLANEEAAVRQKLLELKNSKEFASGLKEEVKLHGGDPVADFNVSLELSRNQENAAKEDSSEIIVIIAAVIVCLLMLAALVWKVCSGGAKKSDELLKTKEAQDATSPDEENATEGSGSGRELPHLEPNSLAVGVGSTWGGGFYPVAEVERQMSPLSEPPLSELPLSDPPLPAPAEGSEVPELENPIKLTDVILPSHPEVSGRPKMMSERQSVQDHQLDQTLCHALSRPSCWTGSLVWTQIPQVRQTLPLPLSKEYKFNFQRAGRLVGHCSDASSQYKITGKHRESGELTWREVPQTSAGMAIECHGRLRRRATATCTSFEIVGVFSAFSTSISSKHLGSGRFNLTTSVQPTSFGNTHEDECL